MDENAGKEAVQATVESKGLEEKFITVENLSANFVTLLHPSLENKRHRTIGPRRIMSIEREFMDSADNHRLVELGFIAWYESPPPKDGRSEALGATHAMEKAALEYMAQQILLFPGENLDNREWRAIDPRRTTPDLPVMAQIVFEIIMAAPKREHDKRIQVEYLQMVHLPLLQNVLLREKIWRARPDIIELLERRIGELRSMDPSGRIYESASV